MGSRAAIKHGDFMQYNVEIIEFVAQKLDLT
jgi:hypothetical protein